LWWTQSYGGYFPRDWYPVAVAFVALLAVVGLVGRIALPRIRSLRLALALFAAFVAWNFLSLLWTPSAGGGWETANKLLFYLVFVTVMALIPWGPRSVSALLGAWVAGVTVAGVASLIGAEHATNLTTYVIEGRYSDPLGYSNAVAALATMTFWPALALSARRGAHPVAQVLFLAAASFLLEFSLVPETRASAAGVILFLPVFLIVFPDRARLLVRLIVVTIVVAATLSPTLDLFTATAHLTPVAPVLDRVADAALLGAFISVALGLLLVAADTATARWPVVAARGRRGALILAVLVTVGGGAVAGVAHGRVSHELNRRWHALEDRFPRLTTSYDEERTDYWRVSLDMFKGDPLQGAGAGAFYPRYTAARRYPKHSRYVHDIWLRALAENGIVGVLLLVGFLGVALWGGLSRIRRLDPTRRALVTACLTVTGYFLYHASGDWMDEFPALATPALGLLFVGLRLARPEVPGVQRSAGFRGLTVAGAGVLVAAALATFVLPYLSGRYVDRAYRRAVTNPAGAYHDVDRAAALNPLSIEPRIAEGTIAISRGDDERARAAFTRALKVEENWYPHFELALLDASAGQFAPARREIARAAALDASDPVVTEARDAILKGKRISPSSVANTVKRVDVDRFLKVQR
jgi:hypothetical protein